MTFLETHNLTFRYSGAPAPSIDSLDLAINRGTLVYILGAAGSGKTTLCFGLTGMLRKLGEGQLSGGVLLNGREVEELSAQELATHIGMVLQNPEAMFCNLHVEDEVAFALENLCWPPTKIKERIGAALEAVGLAGYNRRLIYELSGGEIQRLAIACVLATDPQVLILDEPTSSIDPAGSEAFYQIVHSLRRRGKTVIITSKEWVPLVNDSDNVVILQHGVSSLQGHPPSILRAEAATLIKLGIVVPDATNIGLELAKRGLLRDAVPINLDEALDCLKKLTPVRSTINEPQASVRGVALSISGVSYSYPGSINALDSVTLDIPRGTIVALLGNNGAGKTTLAKLMAGLLRPTKGKISQRLPGKGDGCLPKVCYMFQNPIHQFLSETVYDELALGLRIRGVDEPTIRATVVSILERFGLSQWTDWHPLRLPDSTQRLVALTSLIVLEPDILILDEPSSGQDFYGKNKLRDVLLELKAEGLTIVLITHDLRFVEACADMVAAMAKGRMLFSGPWAELIARTEIMEQAALTLTELARAGHSLALWDGSQTRQYPRNARAFAAQFAGWNPNSQ